MRYAKLLMCLVTLQAVTACDDDGVTGPQSPGPTAVLRFVNAVVDTGTVDFRFIDEVENLPTLLGVPFRGHSGLYQRVASGSRPARVFPTSTDAALTSIMLVDTTVSLTTDMRYTYVYAGRASDNQDGLAVFEDPPTLPSPPAGNIAIKALHVGIGTGDVDVYVVPVDDVAQPTPDDWQASAVTAITNLQYLSQTDYIDVPVRPTDGAAFYRFVVTAAGSTTPLFAATPDLPGAPASGATSGPQPGVQIEGSVLTLVVASGSVPGSRQSTTANEAPTTLLMPDKALDP